ncbi:hypothetical protein [Halococcus sp. PRR34]|uniref:hypothetical protein n=1 Tax=Halococcus sp. PRR34 TaxID=3020830 RepID=UPI00235F1420|nr:hypothetical protein [Halococcus sp. PRR34]
MRIISRRIDIIAAILLLFGSIFGVVAGVRIGIRYIPYISISFGIASIFYIIYWLGDDWRPRFKYDRGWKMADLGIFVGIVGLSALSRHSPGVPEAFYWILAVVFLLITLRVLIAPSKRVIIQILLFAVILRGALWQSAPIVRHDPRLHVGISRFILQTGRLLTDPNYYYRDFPVAHVLSATTSIITELPIKQAYFAALGVPAVLGLIAIFAITRRLAPTGHRLRSALLATAFLAIAAAHVSLSGFPITQTLTLIIHATALVMVVKPNSTRLKVIVVGYIGILLFIHNSAVISLTMLFGALLVSRVVTRAIQRHTDSRPAATRSVSSLVVFLVGGVASIEYLYNINYFHTQVRRVLAIFIVGSKTAQGDISGASFGGLAYTLADPILHIGIGLFITTIGLAFAALVAVKRLRDGGRSELTTVWTPAALGMFGFVGIGIVLAGTGRITRIRPEVLLLIAPVVGVALSRLANRKVGVIAVCLILLATPTLALVAAENSYRNPLTPPTNRAPNDYPVHMSASEVAALNFAEQNLQSLSSGSYVTDTYKFRNLPSGSLEIVSSFPHRNITRSDLTSCNASILYRTSYQSYPGVDRPMAQNAVYDSGAASIIHC